MSGMVFREAVAELCAAFDRVADGEIDLLQRADLVAALDELEHLSCRLPAQRHRLLARLQVEATPAQMGAKSWREVLSMRWRISTAEAGRRLADAEELGPRRTLTGEPLAPLLAATAAAQGAGVINDEHVEVIREAIKRLPGFVDAPTRDRIEADFARYAAGVGPTELRKTADKVIFLLDQDGPVPDDAERARKRGWHTSRQRRDGTVEVRATLTPEAWAIYEAIFAKWAAPGMCNPDDAQPCTSGTPSQAQIDGDQRSLAQRQHDALIAVGRNALESGELGQHNGLPTSIIIRTTLQDLESRAGVGVTGGGTLMPISEVIRLGAHANHYLAVFDGATGSALDLFRTRRIASPAQRIMLIARDGGCTKPACPVGAYGCQAHHAHRDWNHGGNTNVDELALACGSDNRLVDDDGGWATRINARGEVEWIPPPHLDTGQTRINYHHRPERLLRPPDDPEPLPGNDSASGGGPKQGDQDADIQTGAPDSTRDIDEPGGPAPPDNQAA